MDISASIQHITFPTNPATRTPCSPFSSIANVTASSKVLPPSNRATRFLWPPRLSTLSRHTLRTGECVTPQPASRTSPRSMAQLKCMTRDGSASWNSTFNPHTLALSSQHRLLIPRSPSLTPNTAFTAQHWLKAHNHGVTKSAQPSTVAIANSGKGAYHTCLPYPEDESEYLLGIKIDSSRPRRLGPQ
jgi:hypothetical protein